MLKIVGEEKTRIENGESIAARQAVMGWCKHQGKFNETRTFLMLQGRLLTPRSQLDFA
jgi:hypothetical protein